MATKHTAYGIVLIVSFAAVLSPSRADYSANSTMGSERNLGDLSIEQLMNESVTSVSKKETKLNQSPAAISVITQEDIRRLGIASIPEALRLVPGMNVAEINSSQWAISSRGFNRAFANKLLVMIDGRPVYTPSFGGVLWYAQDVMMEDLERIEVIRGPGATLWGANAVNGVINIITRSAKDTQGGLIATSFGTEDRPSTSLRYGGVAANHLYYRVFVKYFNRDGFVDTNGSDTPDGWRSVRSGMRIDWEPVDNDKLTLEASYYYAHVGENVQSPTLSPPFFTSSDLVNKDKGGDIMGRWSHHFSSSSDLTVQMYHDGYTHYEGFNKESRKTSDFDLQQRFNLGAAQEIVWGGGYRSTTSQATSTSSLTWTPYAATDRIWSGFVQDDIAVIPNSFHLTIGSKVEHNEYTGFEIQPGLRLLWTPDLRHTVWSSISRAARTPARVDIDAKYSLAAFQPSPFSPPVLVTALGNRDIKSEKLIAYELGYRVEPVKQLLFDVAGFYNVYRGLVDYSAETLQFDPVPPPGHLVLGRTLQNSLEGETYGVEMSAQWQVTNAWKLTAAYTWLHMRLRPDEVTEGDSPQNQFQLRSYTDLPGHWQLNSAAYFVDNLANQNVPSYLRFDVGFVWHPSEWFEFGIWGQNLFDRHHPEFRSFTTALQIEVPRGVLSKMTYKF